MHLPVCDSSEQFSFASKTTLIFRYFKWLICVFEVYNYSKMFSLKVPLIYVTLNSM